MTISIDYKLSILVFQDFCELILHTDKVIARCRQTTLDTPLFFVRYANDIGFSQYLETHQDEIIAVDDALKPANGVRPGKMLGEGVYDNIRFTVFDWIEKNIATEYDRPMLTAGDNSYKLTAAARRMNPRTTDPGSGRQASQRTRPAHQTTRLHDIWF